MAEHRGHGNGKAAEQIRHPQLPECAGVERLRIDRQDKGWFLLWYDAQVSAVLGVTMESNHTRGVGHTGPAEVLHDTVFD